MRKSRLIKILSAAVALTLVLCSLSSCSGTEQEIETQTTVAETTTEPEPEDINPLTGLSGLSESAIGARPVAVMVENSPDARPQWGLSTPDIVIEGLVEGGITRMMWLYADVSEVAKIGPTRSARHDYVELAEGFDAIFVHFGGSIYAYDTISNDSVDDVDGMYDSSAFARDTSRNVSSEHTAYTTGANIMSMIASKGYRTTVSESAAQPFKFSDETRTLSGGTCQSVLAVFSDSYKHTFKYNSEDGLYYNYMNSSEMKDADGTTMAVSNVIILYTGISSVASSTKGHVDWDLTGGSGVYVSNGSYENITWSKGSSSNAASSLKLTDSSGNELRLNTGKSWIGFIPDSKASSTVIS